MTDEDDDNEWMFDKDKRAEVEWSCNLNVGGCAYLGSAKDLLEGARQLTRL